MVTFDQPSYNKAGTTSSNHAYTMMYMADANGDGSSPGFAASKPTGQSSGPVIFAPIGTGRVVYCWLRNISKADVSGPISGGASGYKATTPVSPSVYINLLNGATFDGLTIKQNGFRVSSPDGTKQVTPFSVLTQDTVMGGITVPAGVYMDGAHIVNLEASVARLGAATIDEAKIGSLSVSKIRTDTMTAAFANVVVGQFNTLSAINSNLGTVTAGTLSSAVSYLGKVSADQISAGTITSSISVSTDGYISASGAGVTGVFGRQATIKGQCSASLGAAGVCGVATGQNSAGVYGAATAFGGVGGYFEATGLAGVGVVASGASADLLLMGSKNIAFDANRTVQIRSDGANLRMSDSSTTDAYLVLVSSYSLSSGSGAVLGSKHPSAPSNSQRGWLVGTCQGQTIYQPFW
ncbi:MAG: hypothetical protein IPO08_23455 [Xanthomonadales bacterium]|nr:hypothetical protein [Xanthomonadales bacterium]